MNSLRIAILIGSNLLTAAICTAGSYYVFDPVSKMSLAQQAILTSYLDAYCRRIEPYFRTQERSLGAMVALSRVSMAADIGSILQVEYLKCMLHTNINSGVK